MVNDICRDLTLLIGASREFLDCSEPSFEAWEDYSNRRNELIGRLELLLPFEAESDHDLVKLQSLITTTLETDALLTQKVQHHLSNFRHQMTEAREQRRAFKAYASIAGAHSSIDRCKA